jgi:hypothetical protein
MNIDNICIKNHFFNIEGYVDPKYLKVLNHFIRNYENNIEDKSQLCVYVKGVKVIDICGYMNNIITNYNRDSLQNVFSSGKSIVSFVIAILVDREYITYNQKIVEIWPEFGLNGKENITIAHLMRHEAGLYDFNQSIYLNDISEYNLKTNKLSKIIENQKPRHKEGSKRVYHSITRGWIVNEILIRVDPKHRNMNQFIKDEIACPLKIGNQISVGLPRELWHLDTSIKIKPLYKTWFHYLINIFKKNTINHSWKVNLLVILGIPLIFIKNILCSLLYPFISQKNKSILKFSNNTKCDNIQHISHPQWKLAHIPSGNIHASARALAKIANCLVSDNNNIISKKGLDLADKGIVVKKMFCGFMNSSFCNAGWNHFSKDRFEFKGWMGAGGSIMQWHSKYKIAFSYTMNLMEITPKCLRAFKLQQILIECLEYNREYSN